MGKVRTVIAILVIGVLGTFGTLATRSTVKVGDENLVQTSNISLELIDLIPQVMESVVHIQCPGWQGSGFVVSEHLIATARHVVEGVEDFKITFNDGTEAKANKALSDRNNDIGFIWIEDPIYVPAVKLGSIKDCVLGQPVVVIGSSYGFTNFNCVSTGIVTGLDRNWNDVDPYSGTDYGWEWGFTTDASGAPGNSGCPLFTMDGVVRGILVGGYDSTHVFLMPSDLFMNLIYHIEAAFEINVSFEFEKIVEVGEYYER